MIEAIMNSRNIKVAGKLTCYKDGRERERGSRCVRSRTRMLSLRVYSLKSENISTRRWKTNWINYTLRQFTYWNFTLYPLLVNECVWMFLVMNPRIRGRDWLVEKLFSVFRVNLNGAITLELLVQTVGFTVFFCIGCSQHV